MATSQIKAGSVTRQTSIRTYLFPTPRTASPSIHIHLSNRQTYTYGRVQPRTVEAVLSWPLCYVVTQSRSTSCVPLHHRVGIEARPSGWCLSAPGPLSYIIFTVTRLPFTSNWSQLQQELILLGLHQLPYSAPVVCLAPQWLSKFNYYY